MGHNKGGCSLCLQHSSLFLSAAAGSIAMFDRHCVCLCVCVLLQDGVSRIHASRRVFDSLKRHGSQLAVLHHIRFNDTADRDDIVINTGTLVSRGRGEGVETTGTS